MDYEIFHNKIKLQNKIISKNNFTYRNIISFLEKNCSFHKNENVLDVGCGTGTLSFYISKECFRVFGIDISTKAIDICKKNAKSLGVQNKCKFMSEDFDKFKTNVKFDYVLCFEVLEHIKEDKKSLIKIFKLLNKNGKVIISVPSINSPLYKLGLFGNYDKKVGHLRRYNQEKLKNIIEEAGFKVLKIEKNEGIARNFLFLSGSRITDFIIKILNKSSILSEIFSLIDNFSQKILGESQIIIIGIK